MTALAELCALAALGRTGYAILGDVRDHPILAHGLGARCNEADSSARLLCWPDGGVRLLRRPDCAEDRARSGILAMDVEALHLLPGNRPDILLADQDDPPLQGYAAPLDLAPDLFCRADDEATIGTLTALENDLRHDRIDCFDLLEQGLAAQNQHQRLRFGASGEAWMALSPLWCQQGWVRAGLEVAMFDDAVAMEAPEPVLLRLPVVQAGLQRVHLVLENRHPHAPIRILSMDPDVKLRVLTSDRAEVIELIFEAPKKRHVDVSIAGHRQRLLEILTRLDFARTGSSAEAVDPLAAYSDSLDKYQRMHS